jgi:hypothetical protein
MLWTKQLYYYDVDRWLDGDPGQPIPPTSRLTGRNTRWRTLNAADAYRRRPSTVFGSE